MKKLLTLIAFNVLVFAQANTKSGAKSHSVDLLHWGRHAPISLNENSLITANSFITSKSREVNVYDLSINQNPFNSQKISSPFPMPGDDFGYSIDHNDNFMVIGSPGYNDGHGSAFIYKKDGNKWVFIKMLTNPNSKDNQRPQKFGYNVSLNNNKIYHSTITNSVIRNSKIINSSISNSKIINSEIYSSELDNTTTTSSSEDNSTLVSVEIPDVKSSCWIYIDGGDNSAGLNKIVDHDGNENAINPDFIVHNSQLYLTWTQTKSSASQIRISLFNDNILYFTNSLLCLSFAFK